MAKFTITDKNVELLEDFYDFGDYIYTNLEELQMHLLDSIDGRLEIEPQQMLEYLKVINLVIRHTRAMDAEMKKGGAA